ncbi:MAG: ATP-binding protein [bacterium]|nr:ATP-binding protein [bacterium]
MIKRIKGNLNFKVFWYIFFLLCFTSAVIYGIVLFSLPDSYKTTMESEIHDDIDTIKTQIDGDSFEQAKKVLYDYAYKNGYEIALLDGYNQILYYSYSENTTQSATYDDENLLVSIVNEGSAVVYTNVILSDVSTTCVLYIFGYGETINSISDILFGFIPLIITIILLLSVTGAFIAARAITHPIKKLSNMSERMASMETNVSCNLNRTDELGVLGNNLDSMYGRLMYTLYELSSRSQQLEYEMNKEKIAEKKRKDFFAAVSHELKTPITILKGELEGMIHQIGEYSDREYYLAHTLQITNEIETLVKEILLISKMSSDSIQVEFVRTNLTDLVYDVYETYITLANNNDIDLICDIEDDIYKDVDETAFRKVVSNLISNAIKYSPEKANVIIEMTEETLRVENSGVHIEEDVIANIFEPFYRGDKSRNRATGGTGLGLYIVKTILDLHGFYYSINNTKTGVVFTIRFPERISDTPVKSVE